MTSSDRTGAEQPSLGRERIVAAALRIVDAEGVGALSMRRLARELGAAPMSLYRYVRDKDELWELLVDGLAGRLPVPAADEPWEETLAATLRAMRRLLLDHPGMVAFVTQRALFTASVLESMERVLAALRRAGLSDRDAARAYSGLWSFTVGSVLLDQSQAPAREGGERGEGERRRIAAQAAERAAGAYPAVAAAAPHWAGMDSEEVFEANLATLVAGIRARAGTPHRG